MLHGPQRGLFDLSFRIPAECADLLVAGAVDIGNVPVVEYARQGLTMATGAGVAAEGAVRSILLVSKCPLSAVRRLAADSSSRTSVVLARIILARRYGVEPEFRPAAPQLDTMLEDADAALIIGDPALRIDPAALPFHVADLGEEWTRLTGLPMVFAVWAGRKEVMTDEVGAALRASCRYGRERIEEIVAHECTARRIRPALAREYLTRHIVNELGPRHYEGLERFLVWAEALSPAVS